MEGLARTLTTLRVIFRKELSTPAAGTFEDRIEYKDKPLWNKSIFCFTFAGLVLFVIHGTFHWQHLVYLRTYKV